MSPVVSGEETQEKGREGAQRAKVWLDSTTRANVRWVNADRIAVKKLTFPWAENSQRKFSFDLAGHLIGGELDGQEFFVESKFYDKPHDQAKLYREYLAKCYRAFLHRPERCDHFMWITWAPFLVESWDELCSTEFVEKAVRQHWAKLCPDGRPTEPDPDTETCAEVAGRLWIIILSQRQEGLVISREHRGVIQKHDIEKGG